MPGSPLWTQELDDFARCMVDGGENQDELLRVYYDVAYSYTLMSTIRKWLEVKVNRL
jgi:hypothetical protein